MRLPREGRAAAGVAEGAPSGLHAVLLLLIARLCPALALLPLVLRRLILPAVLASKADSSMLLYLRIALYCAVTSCLVRVVGMSKGVQSASQLPANF